MPLDQASIVKLGCSWPNTADKPDVHGMSPEEFADRGVVRKMRRRLRSLRVGFESQLP
jgi:hypothetical protein